MTLNQIKLIKQNPLSTQDVFFKVPTEYHLHAKIYNHPAIEFESQVFSAAPWTNQVPHYDWDRCRTVGSSVYNEKSRSRISLAQI